MVQVLGAWTDGLIFALLAMGVYVSFRVLRYADITVDGSYTLGAAVSAILLTEGFHPLLAGLASLYLWPEAWVPSPGRIDPLLATFVACLTGMLAGAVTGVLHTKFKINSLLSSILVMTALYSINLRVMGKSNLPISKDVSLEIYADRLGGVFIDTKSRLAVFHWEISGHDLAVLLLACLVAALVGLALYAFFRTDLGTSLRASGDNDQMIRALGVNVDSMIIGGLALSNGLVALSGAFYAQHQGFADVQMGIGTLVLGLASVIIGEALVGGQFNLGLAIVGAAMGSILYRLVIALVLRAGLNPNDLKLFTAVFVFLALILPDVLKRLQAFAKRH